MPSTSSEVETLGASERGAEAHLEKAAASPPAAADAAPALPDVPDGGLRAWIVVAGATLTLFSSFGVVNSYGVFQSYYSTNRLTQQGESVLALLGAIQLACLYGLGPLIGKIFDSYGCSVLMPLGSFLIVFSLMMLSICQPDQLYQYFLSQAVLFGIGCAMVFTPALAVLGHWFRHRRGLALGMVAGGSSLGGVIYPITLQRLLPRVGFGWAVRVMAFIDLACLVFACITMRTRLPLRRQPAISLLKFIDLGGFRDARFCLATALAFCVFYVLFNGYFFLQQFAELQGMRPGLAQYLLPIINATSIPSRILPGLLADRIGVLNLLIPMVLGSGVLVLALWLPARGDAAIICFAAFYGLLSGGFVSLLPAYIARISPQNIYGARLGSVYAFVAIANLVGTPTAGAFVKAKTQQGFAHLIGFTGAVVLAGGCFGAAAWWLEYRQARREAREKGLEWKWYTIPKI